jgi:hypothetical protein
MHVRLYERGKGSEAMVRAVSGRQTDDILVHKNALDPIRFSAEFDLNEIDDKIHAHGTKTDQ